MTANRLLIPTFLARMALPLLLAFAAFGAMAQPGDPPARAGSLSRIEGSVALAPAGETEWTDAVLNRPITRGDRLWTDAGSRAEVHLGSAVLHVDGQSFLDFTALDDTVLQASLNEGTINARVRELEAGENFEIDTPHLAFRATQPGDYRIDVDPANGTTQVAVRSGAALVYGARGESLQVVAGQQVAFAGRNLEAVAVQPPRDDGFDRWAADLNRQEDEAFAARYLPRDVVGYQQLDPYGSWAQDPDYGAIWFPRVTIADWAPYRYGHWDWIVPWGWTWVDDAPWGFAPFHYGRWAMIGSRWAWVPGRIGRHPVYAPALVTFVGGTGGGSSWSLSIGSRPGIAWYPLGPGEAWRPAFRTSPAYARNVNRYIVGRGDPDTHVHRRRPEAVTAVRVEDFSHGRPVNRHWTRVAPSEIARAPLATAPAMPAPPRVREPRTVHPSAPPSQLPAPGIVGRPPSNVVPPGIERRDADRARPGMPRDEARRQQRGREEPRPLIEVPRQQRGLPAQPSQIPAPPIGARPPSTGIAPGIERRDAERGRPATPREDSRPQRQQPLERQQEEQRRGQQQSPLQREQQLQAQRQQEERRRAQQAQVQREQAVRQQQAAQERMLRQQEAQQRASQPRQALQEQVQRQQQVQQQPQRAMPQPPQTGAPQQRPPQERRDERRPPGEDEGRGRGRAQGRGD